MLLITAGGAVGNMDAGATAGILIALEVSKNVAINFSLSSALLLTVAALIGLAGLLVLALCAQRAGAAA